MSHKLSAGIGYVDVRISFEDLLWTVASNSAEALVLMQHVAITRVEPGISSSEHKIPLPVTLSAFAGMREKKQQPVKLDMK